MIITKAAGCALFAFRVLVFHNQSGAVFCSALSPGQLFCKVFVIVHVCVGLVMSYASYAWRDVKLT